MTFAKLDKRTYKSLNVTVQPLEIDQSNLDTKRMLDLMAVSRDDSPMPLYLHEITRILKEMRLNQQETNEPFNYSTFKMAVEASQMTPAQKGPLTQRLDTLESFMPKWQTLPPSVYDKKIKKKRTGGNDWTIQVLCISSHSVWMNTDSNLAGSTHYSRPLVSLRYIRRRLRPVQHVSLPLPRAEDEHRTRRCTR